MSLPLPIQTSVIPLWDVGGHSDCVRENLGRTRAEPQWQWVTQSSKQQELWPGTWEQGPVCASQGPILPRRCPAHQCAGWHLSSPGKRSCDYPWLWRKAGQTGVGRPRSTVRCQRIYSDGASRAWRLAQFCGNSPRWPQNSINNTVMVSKQQHLEPAHQGIWEQRQEGGILQEGLCSVSPTFRPSTPPHPGLWRELGSYMGSISSRGAFFSPWLQGTLRWLHPTAAQWGSHVDLGQSYSSTSGGGWCLPLVFLLHPGSFFLVLEHSASRTQQWGHVWSVQRTPEFSGKQLQWELLTRSSPGNAAESAVGWRKAALHSWFA